MRVRVCYTVEVDDRYRRALNARLGKPGLATRNEVRAHLIQNGASVDDDLMFELENEEPEGHHDV